MSKILLLLCCSSLCVLMTAETVSVTAVSVDTQCNEQDGHHFVDLSPVFNSSFFDDGIAENAKGGWTDEGTNDFFIYPSIDFKAQEFRGYRFQLSAAENNLLLIGHQETFADIPQMITLKGLNVSGKYLYMMHSEGRIKNKQASTQFTVHYADGSKHSDTLRMNKELSNWYQGKWWNCYEEIRNDAPDLVKKSQANPEIYKQLGGKNFHADMLKHATAKRWPVIQGLNSVSKNWSIPVCFWAYMLINPHPDKQISAISVASDGGCLMGIAGMTISDTDFSLQRQSDIGKMRKPAPAPSDYFAIREQSLSSELNDVLAKQTWTKGVRGIEQRSADIVTLKIDHIASLAALKKASSYTISSNDDPNYKQAKHPVSVARFSRGARYRSVKGDNFSVYADHFMHLQLPHALAAGKQYTIQVSGDLISEHYTNLQRSISFASNELYNPSFKLNQVGYSAAAKRKYIYLSSYLGDGASVDLSAFKQFTIHHAKTGAQILSGSIEKISDKDLQGNDVLYRLDISSLNQDGSFYAQIQGFGHSYTFLNGDQAAAKIYDICHRGMYFQRAGQAIPEQYAGAGKWTRPMAHNKIYVTKENIGEPRVKAVDPSKPGKWHVPEGAREIIGGHYDAGDYDLRPMHINIPQKLLSAYEAMPQKFTDGQVHIPEAGNGIPDIIDEAHWNLLSLVYIQDYAHEIRGLDGGVAPGYETYTHPHQGQANANDPLPYYMRQVHGPFSLAAAAEFAHIARLLKSFDEKRAADYLRRAKWAYGYGVKHIAEADPIGPDGKPSQGEKYDQRAKNTVALWANVELYCSTAEQMYWDEIIRLQKLPRSTAAGSIDRDSVLFSLFLSKLKHPDAAMVEKWKQAFIKAARNNAVKRYDKNAAEGYAASCLSGGGWGNTSCVVVNIESAVRAYMLTGDQDLLDRIATSIDFSLGMNPSEISWMTGAGTVYPMDPLNLNCIDDGIEDPHPGILIYGPTNYWNNDKVVLYPDKSKMGFYRRIVDAWGMVAQCEYTVWETQAPFMFAATCLLPDRK